jgi:hypothetical protein
MYTGMEPRVFACRKYESWVPSIGVRLVGAYTSLQDVKHAKSHNAPPIDPLQEVAQHPLTLN